MISMCRLSASWTEQRSTSCGFRIGHGFGLDDADLVLSWERTGKVIWEESSIHTEPQEKVSSSTVVSGIGRGLNLFYSLGNPVGGNVTSNVTGQDVNYEEWMGMSSLGYQPDTQTHLTRLGTVLS